MRGIRLYAAALPLLALAACAGEEGDNAAANNDSASPPDVAEIVAAGDAQWLNLSGSVVSADANGFVLDYGAGNIRVEMDDWDPVAEGRMLKAGDLVTVSGLADRDLFMNKRVEARSVYVHNLNTVFYASGADEEEMLGRAVNTAPQPYADFTGIVSAVEGREFTLGTGPAAIRVDTSLLAENPLDSQGLQQVKVGDRVLVWGDVDLERSENAELKARGLISMVAGGAAVRAATPASDAPNASVPNASAPAEPSSQNGATPSNSAGNAG